MAIEVSPEAVERLIAGQSTLGEFVKMNRDTQYAIARVAHGLLQTGAPDKALTLYRGLVALSPRDSVFHGHLAAAYLALERFEEALHHYGQAIAHNLANVDALAARGELLLRMGKVQEAALDLASAVKADAGKASPAAQRAAGLLRMLSERAAESAGAAKRLPARKKKPAKK